MWFAVCPLNVCLKEALLQVHEQQQMESHNSFDFS